MDFFFLGRGRAGEEARTRWGLPLAEPADLAAAVPGGVACLLCRLLPLPLACFIAPIPPTPFPSGEGGRGDGGRKEGKGRGQQAAKKAHPPGTCMAGAVRAANGLIPGCRGRSPRQNKLIVSPFPPGRALCERRSGGWGQKSKLKSGAAGNPKGKPPCGFRNGTVSRQPAGQAPA